MVVLACGSMHLPWWVLPAVCYLAIGWGVSAFLTLINLAFLLLQDRSRNALVAQVAIWALYAVPIGTAALMICRVISLDARWTPGWLLGAFGIYGFLLPPLTVCHTVFLARNAPPDVFADQAAASTEPGV